MKNTVPAWQKKFGVAIVGCLWAFRTQSSFWVHWFVALCVIGLAAFLRLGLWQWSVLVLCIGVVMAAEMFNTAIEQLVTVLHPDHDPVVGRALDIAAGAVLVVAASAAATGGIVLGPPLWNWMFG